MFQKPAFGATSSGFGSFNTSTTASPFSGFKPATTANAFGAPPAFGAAAPQPAATGGLFSATNTSGGLFGATTATTPAPAFGATTGGFGFGASTSTGGGLFGANTSTGLFGNTQTSTAFGAKPAGGFGFGHTTTPGTASGGLFGAPSTGLFGQQTNTMSGGGLFANNTGAFGQQQTATGTGHAKYNPVVGTDVVVKAGTSQNINIKHHCITCMKEYEGKSLEELRLEDYTAGRKGAAAGAFGGFQQQPAENKMLFGGSSFSQPATTSAPSVFGGGGLGTGGAFGQSNAFSFGGAAQNTTNTPSLFGANKTTFGSTPTTGTGLFGATTTQAPTFGTNTSSFGFGTTTPNQSGGMFGAKPPATGFGAFGAGGSLFAAKPAQPAAAPFGAPLFGQNTGFNTTTSTAGGIFGANNAFGKPGTTQPSFGLNMQPSMGTGLSTGVGGALQAKPTSTFGTLGGSTMFQQPAQNNTFRTGIDSGLGGMFNNASTLGGSSLGMGMLGTNNAMANTGIGGPTLGANVHEQMLTLAARPYGDSPLFKDLLPDTSTTAEDVLKPTNPSAVKAVLEQGASGFRVTPPHCAIKLQPRPIANHHEKKSLFDGLEESDASLEDKLCLKPGRKRLSLRPKSEQNISTDRHADTNRSVENSAPQREETCHQDTSIERSNIDEVEGARRQVSFQRNSGPDTSSDRNTSWLSSSKLPWSEKEKPMDGEPTPRLYPNLEKETAEHISERRASWLTTKSLRKPLVSNPDSAENSVRELGVRDRSGRDKENIDTLSVSEEENVSPREAPPHPTGVKLTRPGYYTIPSLDDMIAFMRADGSCVVPHLTVGRTNYGNVYYDCDIDVAGLDLDSLVHFLNKEVIVYPEDSDKPPVGSGLNRRAIVTLDRIWPRDKTEKRPITEPDRLLKMDYEGKLRRVCDKHDTKFIEYRPQTGSWVFRVEHFSKYGLTDSDEEDDPTPDVMKRQLVNQSLQKAAAAAPAPRPAQPPAPGLAGLAGPGLAGLGGLGGLAGLAGPAAPEDGLFAMQQTSLQLLHGAGKGFDMDTTEDNTEVHSLYQDRAFGVRSPTGELARLEHRHSHNVQLMKASLYADTEMEDDVSVSTGDQLVPMSRAASLTAAPTPRALDPEAEEPRVLEFTHAPLTEEVCMPPLIVHPHTIVLHYHRKVPPFKQTIAGRLGAACIADMSVSRARHSRVSFGPHGTLVYPTSYDSITDLPKEADMSELGKYVRGRMPEDWSEPVVARLAIGQVDTHYNIQEILSRHLETLLKYSTSTVTSEDVCPQMKLRDSPEDRLAVLREHLQHASRVRSRPRFGVSGAYCYEVWSLCEALWGADLQNGGVPAHDEASIVLRHKKLLAWLAEAVADVTDEDLSRPTRGESEDESDGHSARVWTLMLGGRVLEACQLARKHGDLNMAVLIAQGAGDPTFRSLVAKQLCQWRECGALGLVSAHRLASLRLVAGLSAPADMLQKAGWLRTLHATARYLCPAVPSLEAVVRKFERFYTKGEEDEDLTTMDGDEMGMQFPLPPYMDEYDVSISRNGRPGRVLDLRYELLRARAFNTRPKLLPASYTPDPLDYSLCFLLQAWLGSASPEAVWSLGAQLEAAGAWHLAVLVLAFHPQDAARGHLIRGVLSRHAPAKADTPELRARLELVRRLHVPEKWLLLAQAHRAKYERLPALEAAHLVGAGSWNAAHTVLLQELMPDAVLADDLQSIAGLLEQLNAAASQQLVSGWEAGGQALYYYHQVCTQMRAAVEASEAEAVLAGSLEALRPTLAAAARSLARLQASSARQQAARAEMGARLVQIALAAGEPTHHLAALLRALNLPPDCTQHANLKITTDLASHAAELCIESPMSSPLSSRHAAMRT